jgi:hypothetical protein
MRKTVLGAAALVVLIVAAEFAGGSAAQARGGAANIMNSPGYQRRLQESRGYVTNRSGSIFAAEPAPPALVHHPRKVRRRH